MLNLHFFSTLLEAERQAIVAQRPVQSLSRVRAELLELAQSWRRVLVDDPTHARPIVLALLKNRVTYTPVAPKKWQLRGEGTLSGLFSRNLTCCDGVPSGIRTRVTGVKGRRPGPLDDGDKTACSSR